MRTRPTSLLLSIVIAAHAAVASAQPAITRPVTDEAGVLSSEAVTAIEARLHAHRDAGHPQIALLIVPTLQGAPITDYALRAAEAWGGGSRAHDDGVLFVLATEDRVMRIEVGYGLEETLPDSAVMRILDGLVEPLRAGRFDAAAWIVSDALIAGTGGASEPMPDALAVGAVLQRPEPPPAEQWVGIEESWPPSSASDAAFERSARESEARTRRFLYGFVFFFVLPVLLVFLYLWRSSNAEYDSDGAQHVPWHRLPADVAAALGAIGRGLADGGGGGGGGAGGGHRGATHGSSHRHGSSHSHGSSHGHGGSSRSSRSYSGGGGGFGGGGASKRW